MKVVKRIEATNLIPVEIDRLAEEAGALAVQRYRKAGFH